MGLVAMLAISTYKNTLPYLKIPLIKFDFNWPYGCLEKYVLK